MPIGVLDIRRVGILRPMDSAWRRVAAVAITAMALPFSGCSASSESATTTAIGSPATSVVSTSQAVTSTCRTNDLTNLPPPDQVVPDVPGVARVIGVDLLPFPEGPVLELDEQLDDKGIRDVLSQATALLEHGLPAALPQECCTGRQVKLHFDNGLVAIYGPCNLPKVINDIAVQASKAWAAAHS